MFQTKNIYSLKERFISDYHRSPQWGWIAIGIIWGIIIYLILTAHVIGARSDQNLTFGGTLQASQTEMGQIYALAKKISKCEGFYKKGSLAQRNRNPGNLKSSSKTDRQGHTIYDSELEGWTALYRLLYKHRKETLRQMSRWYASSSNVWYNCINSI
jgi:hypothetical protein